MDRNEYNKLLFRAANMPANVIAVALKKFRLSQRACDLINRFCPGIHPLYLTPSGAARCGHIGVARSLRKCRIWCDDSALFEAIEGDHMHMVRYLLEHDAHRFKHALSIKYTIIYGGSLEIVQYMSSFSGVECGSDAADVAASCGKLDILKYLYAHHRVKCSTYFGADPAAENGFLEVLKFLYAHGVKCSYNGIIGANQRGRRHILKFFKEHDKELFKDAASSITVPL